MIMQPNLKKLLKHMEQIEAKEVKIIGENEDIIIENPRVFRVNMMGQEVFQITGTSKVEERIKEEDVKLVMEKTNKPKEEVIKKLKENKGDIAKTILDFT